MDKRVLMTKEGPCEVLEEFVALSPPSPHTSCRVAAARVSLPL